MTLLRMHMFKTRPSANMFVITELPPALIKGRVMPVTGMRPMVIPMFSKI